MAPRKSPVSIIDGISAFSTSWSDMPLAEDRLYLGDGPDGNAKLVHADRSTRAIAQLDLLMQRNRLKEARNFAASVIRGKYASPEFLNLVAELLSPTTKKARGKGRPPEKIRKFEREILSAYWLFGRSLTPAKARRLVIEEFKSVVSDRTINGIITRDIQENRRLARKLGVDERQIAPFGFDLYLRHFFKKLNGDERLIAKYGGK